jgi:hypothetical protein
VPTYEESVFMPADKILAKMRAKQGLPTPPAAKAKRPLPEPVEAVAVPVVAEVPAEAAKPVIGQPEAKKAKKKRPGACYGKVHPRLPPGTTKTLTFLPGDVWKGEMTVAAPDGGVWCFDFTTDPGGTEANCYHGLDGLYRAELAKITAEKVEVTP